ncbi:VOC family protein [Mycobacterium colombiense]|uniref:VOC family protein n=1 Tax=Mycobacterium colombiense TaxID=339268 RepID=UPI00200AFB6B|nr:VOC family protein [Mycobacterium colombiense]MCK8647129.1 VOC family protein [Mycobacterium colombiense]
MVLVSSRAPDAPSRIRSLGYLGLTAPDLSAWRSFATDVCGLQIANLSTDDQLLLRMDNWSWRISIEPGDGRLAYAGWEVTGEDDLNGLAEDLDQAGIPVEADPATAERRGVQGLVRAKDPAGNQVEFFHGPTIEKAPFVSPLGVRFLTAEQGLGHIVLVVPDIAEAKRFYLGALGFRVSDRIRMGPVEPLFTHVNPRHHSLAMAEAPGLSAVHHFMLEVDDLDAVGRALDGVLAGAAPLTSTLGKHSNDQMVSFYMKTPSECQIEYGWNGLRIDDSQWTTAYYNAPSVWGHHPVEHG